MDEDGSCQKGRVETDYVSALYRENTTPITIKHCNAYFHARGLRLVEPTARRGGYCAFAPAMLVLCITISCLISPLNTHIS